MTTPLPHPATPSAPPAPDGGAPGTLLDAITPMLPDLSVGALLGFATGLALRWIGRIVLVVVGVLFIAIQLMAYFELVSVNWLKLQALTEPWFRQGGEQGSQWLGRVLTANLPFAGAFTAGLLVGLRARV